MNFFARLRARITKPHCWVSALVCLQVLCAPNAQSRDWLPTADSEVVETLPPRLTTKKASTAPSASAIQEAEQAARQAITVARQTADPRYLGRAQAILAPWWDRPDAPVALAVLQATVQQSRHEFAAARITLEGALRRDPSQAQGWLTLATLERVGGRYEAARAACTRVAQAGAALYAIACELETTSLQGQHAAALRGFDALLREKTSTQTALSAWLLSLRGEVNERAGLDAAALLNYQASLALTDDGYTALVAADLLLRTGRAPAALKLLEKQPDSDAVLLRRAYAAKQANDASWQRMASELRGRFAALDARGDDPALHARERALAYLWLDQDGARALAAASLNLGLQKEPFDWWLALQSAELAAASAALSGLRADLAATGLRDARLARWQSQ